MFVQRQKASVHHASQLAEERVVVPVTVVLDRAVDELDDGADAFVAGLGIGRVHVGDDFHDGARLDAVLLGHDVPDHVGQVEEQRHEREDERHPLVVVDAVDARLRRVRQEVVGGHVVVVRDPADVVRVAGHGAREVRRHPAGDGRAHELRAAHQHREDEQEDDGDAVRQPVAEVVVLHALRVGDFFEYVDELPHHGYNAVCSLFIVYRFSKMR